MAPGSPPGCSGGCEVIWGLAVTPAVCRLARVLALISPPCAGRGFRKWHLEPLPRGQESTQGLSLLCLQLARRLRLTLCQLRRMVQRAGGTSCCLAGAGELICRLVRFPQTAAEPGGAALPQRLGKGVTAEQEEAAPCAGLPVLTEGQGSCRFSCCLSHVAGAGAGGVPPAPSLPWGMLINPLWVSALCVCNSWWCPGREHSPPPLLCSRHGSLDSAPAGAEPGAVPWYNPFVMGPGRVPQLTELSKGS